jgi:triosephosphate isomerase
VGPARAKARRPLVVGNWKMHMMRETALRLAQEIIRAVDPAPDVEVVLCPPLTALDVVDRAIAGTPFLLGAQTMHWAPQGAYTGEVSAPMLVDAGCHVVIIGHSERRQYFGETDETVGKKVQAALAHRLVPIVCVGERLGERESRQTDAVITRQIRAACSGVGRDAFHTLVIAYEPVWAIGTGRTATGSEANRVAGIIRRLIGETGGGPAGDMIRILYGGSVKPENIREFLQQPEIDGALVGGASLDAASFAAIVRAAQDGAAH